MFGSLFKCFSGLGSSRRPELTPEEPPQPASRRPRDEEAYNRERGHERSSRQHRPREKPSREHRHHRHSSRRHHNESSTPRNPGERSSSRRPWEAEHSPAPQRSRRRTPSQRRRHDAERPPRDIREELYSHCHSRRHHRGERRSRRRHCDDDNNDDDDDSNDTSESEATEVYRRPRRFHNPNLYNTSPPPSPTPSPLNLSRDQPPAKTPTFPAPPRPATNTTTATTTTSRPRQIVIPFPKNQLIPRALAVAGAIPPVAVHEVMTILSPLLQHIPHAVLGVAAMCLTGYRGRLPDHITIVAPEDCQDTLLTWARANGNGAVVREIAPDTLGVRTADGLVRPVRVRYVAQPWRELRIDAVTLRARDGSTVAARMLSLASMVDVIARCWLDVGAAGMTQQCMSSLAADARWLIGQMVVQGRRFDPGTGSALIRTDFWEPLTALYPDVAELCRAAGVPVDVREKLLAWDMDVNEEEEEDQPPSEQEEADAAVAGDAELVSDEEREWRMMSIDDDDEDDEDEKEEEDDEKEEEDDDDETLLGSGAESAKT